MILGRPTTLWLAAITALINVAAGIATSNGITITVEQLAGINLAAAALVGLIATQPPTLKVGDAYTVQTPAGSPNVSKVANTNVTPIPPNAGTITPPGG